MKFTGAVLKTKFKATGIHLCMSIAVFAYLAYQIYYNWYPQPYFEVDGGWQGIRLVGAVDLVLGPFITFLIFDLRKSRREIIFDLLTILVIQFGALAYGIHTTYAQRPVAIVLIDEFVVPTTMEHFGGKLESVEQLRKYSDEKPPIIFAELPLDSAGLQEVIRIKTEQKVLENAQLQLYRTQPELRKALEERQALFNDRLNFYGGRRALDAWLEAHDKSMDEILISPFDGRYGKAWLLFDKQGNYLSYLLPSAFAANNARQDDPKDNQGKAQSNLGN